jgi:hypothetical protein
MNIAHIVLKRREESSFYKTSQKRYQIKVKLRNLNKEQAAKAESVLRKLIQDVLPAKEES